MRLSNAPEPSTQTATDGKSNNQRLKDALLACLEAEAKIPEEQEKLRKLLRTVPFEGVEYRLIEYQIDLVAAQLTRAAEIAEARLAYWDKIRTPADEAREKAICESDTKHFIRWWGWSVEPREDAPLTMTPFGPFDAQNEAVDWAEELMFIRRRHGVLEKSRDMGATWLFILMCVKHWLFRPQFTALWGSINEDKVDKIGAKDTIFEKARVQLRYTPEFMMPKGYKEEKHATFLKIFNPENEAMISGEASTQNFGRSGRYSCLTGDTMVTTPDGLFTFEELLKELPNRAAALDSKGGLADKPIRGVLVRLPEQTIEVTTQYGFRVRGSLDHPMLVERSGERTWVTLGDMRLGDRMILTSTEGATLPTDAVVGEDEAAILGYLVSEGTVNTRSKVEFAQKDEQVMDHFLALWRSVYSNVLQVRRVDVQREDGYRSHYNVAGGSRAEIRKRLAAVGLERAKAADKSIPWSVRRAPRGVMRAFLRTLFEGDGCASVDERRTFDLRISYTSKSETLVRQIQTMLLYFGIVSAVRLEKRRETWKLVIGGHGMAFKFAREIGFVSDRKQRVCAEARETQNSGEWKEQRGEGVWALPVVRVDPREAVVTYDIQVDGEQFLANGLVSHNCVFLDEHAFWPFLGKPQWASVSSSVKTCISFSTVCGTRTKQYELRMTPKMPVFTLRWTRHPWKDKRWYAGLSLSMKTHEIAQEVDIDYKASVSGRLFSEYSELHHVVTWSEFAEMFGAVARDSEGKPRLPARGLIGRGQDVGTTEQHPNATVWAYRPAEGMPFEAWPFVYREAVFPEFPVPSGIPPSIGRIAEYIHEVERPWGERARVQMSMMSHEGASERQTYIHDVPMDHQIHWSPWAVSKRAGISQVQNFLTIDWTQRHPVRRYPEGYIENGEDLSGQLIHGRPRMLFVVADGQGEIYLAEGGVLAVMEGVDADGLCRLRAEMPQYALPQDTSGDEKPDVKPLFNDCVDALKGIAQKFFPTPEEASAYERAHRALEAKGALIDNSVFALMDPVAQGVAIIRNMTAFSRELEKQSASEGAVVNQRFQTYQE